MNNYVDLSEFCARGSTCVSKRLVVAEGVDLQLYVFKPPQEYGNPPILFIPGWISQMSGWKDVLLELTKRYQVYYLETREKVSAKLTGKQEQGIAFYRQDIISACEKLGLFEREYILLGSSLGATAILDADQYLRRKPKAMILIGPNAEFRIPWWGVIIIKLLYPGVFVLVKWFLKFYLKNFRLNADTDMAQYRKYMKAIDLAEPFRLKKAALALRNYKVWDILDKIHTQVLVVGGTEDKLHEPQNMMLIIEKLPNVKMLDMKTNSNTHSKEMVLEMEKYLNHSFAS